eukprot:CAMPEP_0180785182 /NCGR_PEP_ID=MMETSP1038_2-20121128/50040_1 /TAXON_ID=632150 /ORGANISM="Azadinium spinosum, Strain 3D9" /LENGTH=137 /DNA_ID=CAMNT_0022822039 /DNA_START=24 /DNA_END=439 /DNA_ORIENTATION=-
MAKAAGILEMTAWYFEVILEEWCKAVIGGDLHCMLLTVPLPSLPSSFGAAARSARRLCKQCVSKDSRPTTTSTSLGCACGILGASGTSFDTARLPQAVLAAIALAALALAPAAAALALGLAALASPSPLPIGGDGNQ